MSHFTVLVVGDNPEKQLAPYHEFECTGRNDEYVQTIDILPEALKKYNEQTTTTPFLKWCQDWYGISDSVGVGELPDLEGAHKYGYAVVNDDGRVVELYGRTNPNAKWDWYTLGGRWTGFFLLKPGANQDEAALGSPGLMTKPADPNDRVADVARKRDIDFLAMRDQAGAKAGMLWTKFHNIIDKFEFISWPEMLKQYESIDDARKAYHNQPAVKALNQSDDPDLRFAFWDNDNIAKMSYDEYVDCARNGACATFAVVVDGQWYECGKMGLWGVVSDEKEQDKWIEEFASLIDGLPDDTLLSVVDCHI